MIGHMSQTPPAGESNEMFVAILIACSSLTLITVTWSSSGSADVLFEVMHFRMKRYMFEIVFTVIAFVGEIQSLV